jgi:hypothetical protein
MRRHRSLLATAAMLGVYFSGFLISSCDVPLDIKWIRQFGTTGDANDIAFAIVADSGSNVFVAGQTNGALPGRTNAGNADAFVRMLDSNGNEIWTHRFGTSANDAALTVFVDPSGNVYVAGFTQAIITGSKFFGGNGDAFLRKLDSNGNELWTRQFGSLLFERVFAIVGDNASVYLAGQVNGTLPGQTSAGGFDAFVKKYDAAGNEIWTQQFGTVQPTLPTGSRWFHQTCMSRDRPEHRLAENLSQAVPMPLSASSTRTAGRSGRASLGLLQTTWHLPSPPTLPGYTLPGRRPRLSRDKRAQEAVTGLSANTMQTGVRSGLDSLAPRQSTSRRRLSRTVRLCTRPGGPMARSPARTLRA